jgi:hypothetical protein
VLLSTDQQTIRETFGPPEQFLITYLPQGPSDNPRAVRSEVWYYPKHSKQVSFLGGKTVAVTEFNPKETIIGGTSLRPEEFDIYMGYDEVAKIVGKLNIERFDFPVFFDDTVETYASDQALFIIEEGYLTYIQTIGISAEDLNNQFDSDEAADTSQGASTVLSDELYGS